MWSSRTLMEISAHLLLAILMQRLNGGCMHNQVPIRLGGVSAGLRCRSSPIHPHCLALRRILSLRWAHSHWSIRYRGFPREHQRQPTHKAGTGAITVSLVGHFSRYLLEIHNTHEDGIKLSR